MDGPCKAAEGHEGRESSSNRMGAAGSTAGGSFRPHPHLVTRPVVAVAPPAAEPAAAAASGEQGEDEEEERSIHEQRAAAKAEVLALEEEGEGQGSGGRVSPRGRVPTPTSAPIPIPGQAAAVEVAAVEAAPAKSVRFREEEGKGDGDSEPAPPLPPRVVLADRAGLVVGSSEGLSGDFTPSYAAYTPSARTMHDLRYVCACFCDVMIVCVYALTPTIVTILMCIDERPLPCSHTHHTHHHTSPPIHTATRPRTAGSGRRWPRPRA